ncbi:MAG: hypothetical protein NE327_15410 [Lentisphaeraceae bacterium]|nr:hypothetical protein [Lentisphaeraceae bacterium]
MKFLGRAFLLIFCSISVYAQYPIKHNDIVKIPNSPKPEYLIPYKDPVFGSTVRRISGNPGDLIPNIDSRWNAIARQGYSKDSAWNCDQSLIILKRHDGFPSKIFLDGSSYKPLFGRNSIPGSEILWHPKKPDIMFYVNNSKIGYWNVRTDKKEVIKVFEGYSELCVGPWEGNLSGDGSKVVLVGKKGTQKVAFSYDLAKNIKYKDLALEEGKVDWVSISYSGKYMVFNLRGDQTQIYDLNGKEVGKLWAEYGRPSHYDLTVDGNGDDIAVGVSKSKPDEGRIIKRRLKDGKVTVLTKGGYGGHTSTRNILRPGWAYVTYQYKGPDWGPYWDEIVAVKLDGSLEVERIAHIHTGGKDYLNQAHAVPSPDGKRVIFASSWDIESGRPINAYVVERASEGK